MSTTDNLFIHNKNIFFFCLWLEKTGLPQTQDGNIIFLSLFLSLKDAF